MASRIISDRDLIVDGLSRLATAKNRPRIHEYFRDGYRIQIITMIETISFLPYSAIPTVQVQRQ